MRTCSSMVAAVVLAAAVLAGQGPAPQNASAQAQTTAAQSQITAYLNGIGFGMLDRREQALAQITTRAAADARKAAVRARVLDLVGGLPAMSGAVAVKKYGSVEEDGFRVENIAYESTPGYWVTANVFVPQGQGPFPAIVIAPGHGTGKASQFTWGANFARMGILTLSIDPMGQGERIQHWDAELGASKLEPSGEHEHANQTALLVGQHVARYWFADGIRGVDYLQLRADVDRARIGTFGCSGGGTAAAYLAAMDPRIRVAAIASFITSFRQLLPDRGPQDAEQTLPSVLAANLDFADWVEQAAPRPVAIVAFETDFFPLAGARQTYQEARRFYSLYGAEPNLELIAGPGGHCNLGPVTPRILEFLLTHLKGRGALVPAFTPIRPKDPDELTVMPTGQVSTSIGSATVESLTRMYAKSLARPPDARLPDDVRRLAGIGAIPGSAPPKVTTATLQQADGYRIDRVAIESEPGILLDGMLAVPSTPGPHPAVVWMDAAPLDRTIAASEFTRLARSGHVVLAFHPRAVLGEPAPNPNQLALGQYMPLLLRAIAVGKTLIGMRTDDTLRTIDWLVTQPGVDRGAVTVYGAGAQGMVALHAAALDKRITAVVAENTLVSYRTALNAGLHKNLSEVLIPGVLTRYDVPDLVAAIAPRRVTLLNPANPMGQAMRDAEVRAALPALPKDARVIRRMPGDLLPIE